VAEQEGEESDAARADVFGAVAAVEADRLADAAVMAEAAVRLGKKHSLETVVLVGTAVQATLAMMELPDTTYVTTIVRAIDRLENVGRFGAAALALMMLARAHVTLGDMGASARTLARAASLAGRAGHVPLEARLRDRAASLGG
jgi:fructose-1,6-bisphosphatase/inositol monophosphatase family enzyme